jgi:hypothetical protein
MGNPQAIVPVNQSLLRPLITDVSQYQRKEGRDPKAYGTFSAVPTYSEKWVRHAGLRSMDSADTMARMFIRVPPGDYDKFLKELDDPQTQTIARYLTGDDAGKGGVGYLDFLLHMADHSYSEKVQICEVLSDNYVAFFFGHQAPIFTYQGTLYNTYQDDWTMRMLRIFRDLGRGTQLARRGLVLYLKYDSIIVQGAMLNFHYSLQGGREMATNFDFSLLVKKVNIIYGGTSTPTDLVSEKHFAPAGYHTDDSGSAGAAATNTYMGTTPDSVPAGTQDYYDSQPSYYDPQKTYDPAATEQMENPQSIPSSFDAKETSPPFQPAAPNSTVPQPHQGSGGASNTGINWKIQ